MGFIQYCEGQIGTNPSNPTNNDAFSTNQKPKFKGDSGTIKHLFTSKSARLIHEKDLTGDSLTLHKLDTSINGKERYSPLYPYNNYKINLGGLGLPQMDLIPDFKNQVGFNNGQKALSLYLLQSEDLEYYRNKSPYTELAFLTGGKREQWFSLIHSQNINPRLSIGLRYFRVGSQGFYQRQGVDDLNLAFFSWYQSRNYRYNLLANLVFNSLNAKENGGVQSDSLFSSNSTVNHDYQNVYLLNAQTTWNQTDFYVKQIYNIGHLDSLKDNSFRANKIYPLLQAKYTIHYKLNKYSYGDILPGNSGAFLYYPNIFIDSITTHDQTNQRTLENEFGLSFFGHGNLKKEGKFSVNGAHLEASIKDQIINYRQNHLLDTSINNLILHGNLAYNLSDRFSLEIMGDYNLIGANHSDYFLNAKGLLNFGEKVGILSAEATLQLNQPDFIFDRYTSNAYQWNYHFNKVRTQKLLGLYENTFLKFKASVEINLLDGYTYFTGAANQLVFPAQFANEIRIFRIRVDKEFNYHNLGLQIYGVYQKNNQSLIVRSPELYGFASLFYQKTLFGVLRSRIGLEGTYFSKNYLYDYAPGLQQFYVYSSSQNGNTPVVNLFLVLGLKRVKLTLKYDYLNQGIPQKGFYLAHNYPGPDGIIKFGVSWKFYD